MNARLRCALGGIVPLSVAGCGNSGGEDTDAALIKANETCPKRSEA